MIGITIASPEFEYLAVEAAKRFRKHTDVKKTIILSTEYEKNYKEKLSLTDHIGNETAVFFDSDLWFVRDVSLKKYDKTEKFYACSDPGCHPDFAENHFPYLDSKNFGIDPAKYFNGGFFIFNKLHTNAFNLARELYANMKVEKGVKMVDGKPLKDFGEQSLLNYALTKLGFNVKILDQRFNYMPFAVLHVKAQEIDDPYAIHAAGYGFDSKFPNETAGQMKERALLGYEYQFKSDRTDFYQKPQK